MARDTATGEPCRGAGFTLLELVVVLAILGLLLAGTIAAYGQFEESARERALRETLRTVRDAIDAYRADRDTYPSSLGTLVEAGYLSGLPEDPVTGAPDWTVQTASTASGGEGVWDLHSASSDIGSDGIPYSEW